MRKVPQQTKREDLRETRMRDDRPKEKRENSTVSGSCTVSVKELVLGNRSACRVSFLHSLVLSLLSSPRLHLLLFHWGSFSLSLSPSIHLQDSLSFACSCSHNFKRIARTDRFTTQRERVFSHQIPILLSLPPFLNSYSRARINARRANDEDHPSQRGVVFLFQSLPHFSTRLPSKVKMMQQSHQKNLSDSHLMKHHSLVLFEI